MPKEDINRLIAAAATSPKVGDALVNGLPSTASSILTEETKGNELINLTQDELDLLRSIRANNFSDWAKKLVKDKRFERLD